MTFSSLKQRIDRPRAYSRTRRELRALPLHVRLDLDIAGIEDQVARRAVYRQGA